MTDDFEQIKEFFLTHDGILNGDTGEFVQHYGTPHDGLTPHSGRYEYGSGKDPYQNAINFRAQLESMKSSGAFSSDTELAKALGLSTTEYRAYNSISKDEITKHNIREVAKLKERGWSRVAIAKELGLSGESQVRSLEKQALAGSVDRTNKIADVLEAQVKEKKYLDIGRGVETQLGCTQDRLKVACKILEERGYTTHNIKVPQVSNPKQKTTVKVLTKDGVTWSELYDNLDKITSVSGVYTEDKGKTLRGITKPVAISSNRVMIRYNEEGGVKKDGVIELRRGVEDLSLHNAHYAQVRIDVDGTHYLKGMAIYAADQSVFPKGVDVIFNTNKHVGTPKMDVLKPLKDDPENPFGATIKNDDELIRAQLHYIGKDGKEHQSALNIVNEEGNWGEWKKTVASQVLSKQPVTTARKQLKIASDRDVLSLKEILSYTNPVVKKKMLEDFAESADARAVELKAAKFPRQASHVILPINTLKENEIYAPNYKQGEEVVLIRFPHAGPFEMPKLIVNNRNKEGIAVITPNGVDAVGINHRVAQQLSGADFDGDNVLVVPTYGQNIKVEKARKDLVDFEPKELYKNPSDKPKTGPATGFQKQKQMGMVSNLITDMQIRGASPDEITRAVKHSMVVIDAEKHNLDWRQSEKDFRIDELKRKYQKKPSEDGKERYGGASTLISRASGEKRIDETKAWYLTKNSIDSQGNKVYTKTHGTHEVINKKKDPDTGKIIDYIHTGKFEKNTTSTTNMAATRDAMTLSSGTAMEKVYADYANTEKALANQARLAAAKIKAPKRDSRARVQYANEVASLQAKLTIAKLNAPKERQAQLIANKVVQVARKQNPDRYDDKDELKKLRQQALKGARLRTGADGKGTRVDVTPREWEAIEANAISKSTLEEILLHTDMDKIRDYAMPKDSKRLSNARIARIRALAASNYDTSEIAADLGISTSTVQSYLLDE